MNFTGEVKKFKKVIEFFEEKLKYKDFSILKEIQLNLGYNFYGACIYPYMNQNFYLIKCRLKEKQIYPSYSSFKIRKKNSCSLFKTIITCDNCFDDMIWVVGHELFHYLRDTRQIEGKNTEAQANEFGLKCLKEFQRNHPTIL